MTVEHGKTTSPSVVIVRLDAERKRRLVAAIADCVVAHVDELTALNSAIGDGDHGHNMKRGFETVLQDLEALSGMSLPDLVKGRRHEAGDEGRRRLGSALRDVVLGAGERASRGTVAVRGGERHSPRRSAPSRRAARAMPVRRQCSTCLFPAYRGVRCGRRSRRHQGHCGPRGGGDRADAGDARARVLSRRSLDRAHGSRRALIVADDRDALRRAGRQLMANVGIVIVSHSPKVAEGAADMVRQMVGKRRPARLDGRQSGRWSRDKLRGDQPTPSTAPGRMRASPFSSILAALRPIARWRSRCCPRTSAALSWSATRRSSRAR